MFKILYTVFVRLMYSIYLREVNKCNVKRIVIYNPLNLKKCVCRLLIMSLVWYLEFMPKLWPFFDIKR